MKILIETIPHSQQRYETVGDWQWKREQWSRAPLQPADNRPGIEDVLHIRVSELRAPQMEVLLMVHELVEALLCEFSYPRVTEKMVDDFDNLFIQWQQAGIRSKTAEAGDDDGAPYARQHCMATAVERMLAAYIGVPWEAYETVILGMSKDM